VGKKKVLVEEKPEKSHAADRHGKKKNVQRGM